MSTEKKQSLGIVVTDIDFFFSHRVGLAKQLSEKTMLKAPSISSCFSVMLL
jgi:hypothetical protein